MRAERYLDALRASPIISVHQLTGGRAFAILSPHPDDETLGAGGLIASACAEGQTVNVIIVTDGSGSHPRSKQYPRQSLINLRYAETHKAGLALGMQPGQVTFLGLPDTAAPRSGPQFDTAVGQIVKIILQSKAGSLLVTWEEDPHCDHQASVELAKAVRRLIPGLKLWAYPIWGWHLKSDVEISKSNLTSQRIDISKHRGRKVAAIAAHASQMTDLISDDPDGFRFDQKSLSPFLGNYEYFIEVPV